MLQDVRPFHESRETEDSNFEIYRLDPKFVETILSNADTYPG